jgi:hypothetical protein
MALLMYPGEDDFSSSSRIEGWGSVAGVAKDHLT